MPSARGVDDDYYLDKKVLRELIARERRDRLKIKDSDERKVLEEVFDERTLLTIYSLMNRGVLRELRGVVRGGKEARVYWGVGGDGREVAIKIYYTVTSQFKKRLEYVEGDPRFVGIKRTPYGITDTWARKEYVNLVQAHEAGVPVPKPIAVKNNVLVMEFIGERGVPAPLLAEAGYVDEADYETIVGYIKALWSGASLVHADLSEYNVFKWEGGLVLLDFGSSVDKNHPNALEFLMRDINNINRFFSKKGVRVKRSDEVFEEVVYS